MTQIIYGPWRWDGERYVPGFGYLGHTWSAYALTSSPASRAAWYLRHQRVPRAFTGWY